MDNDDVGNGSLKDKPLVSVIIPTHNRADLLREALDSVYTQEGVGKQFEMEIIVVDDASSDATPETARQYPGVRYLRHDTNRGESAARNTGIKASQGKYLAFLDDDDLWLPHKLSVQVPVLETHPEAGVVYGQNVIRNEGLDNLWPDARRAPSGNVFCAFLVEDFISINTVVVRREVFQEAGYFDESLKTMQYYDMCLRLAFHIPFIFIPGNVAVQRYSSQGTWTTTVVKGVYEQTHSHVVERALAMLPDTDEYARVKRQARIVLFCQIAKNLASVAARGWIESNRLRAHVLTGLRASPWLATEPSVRALLARSVGRVALVSASPIAATRHLCVEIGALSCRRSLWERLGIWRLIADVWTDVAIGLGSGSRPHIQAAGYAATHAVLHDPTKLARKNLLRLMVLSLIRPHMEPT